MYPEDIPSSIMYLEKGLVKQYVISHKGTELIIHIFKPGSFFYLMWAINNSPNSYYFEALTPIEIYKAPLEKANMLMKQELEILYDFTSRLLKGISGVLKRLESLVLDPAYIKLVSLLTYFAKSIGEKVGETVTIQLPLTHKELATWIGTTRETTSIQMESLKKKGLISYTRKMLVVKNLKKLENEMTPNVL